MALSYAQLESKPQIKTTITGVQRNAQTCATKKTRTQKILTTQKQKRKTDCGCELLRAHNATRNAQPQRPQTQHSRVDSHAQRADRSYVRDSQKRRRYETRAVRSISLRILRDIETIAPSVRSNTQQAKLDRNFLRSGFGTRKTFSSSKPIFLTSVAIKAPSPSAHAPIP